MSPESAPQTPRQIIESALEQLVGDPQRIMPGERSGPQGEPPLEIRDRDDGHLLAEIKTVYADGPVVMVDSERLTYGKREHFNYSYQDGSVVYVPPSAEDERLQGEAAQQRLADRLTEILKKGNWPDLSDLDNL